MSDADRPSLSGSNVGAILLAAGGSTRLGRPKQLLMYRGRTLLRHAVEQALASRARPLVVVLGADEVRCQQELSGFAATEVVIARNPDWAVGMGSSIATGVTTLIARAPDVWAAIIVLCDQPLVTADVLDTLIARHTDAPDATVAAHYAGEPGVPALFPRARFDELARLDGASGAKRLLRASGGTPLITVPCPEAAIDVDTLADYEALPHAAP
jgi:molybdenum cofactor cytidylyltransferase